MNRKYWCPICKKYVSVDEAIGDIICTECCVVIASYEVEKEEARIKRPEAREAFEKHYTKECIEKVKDGDSYEGVIGKLYDWFCCGFEALEAYTDKVEKQREKLIKVLNSAKAFVENYGDCPKDHHCDMCEDDNGWCAYQGRKVLLREIKAILNMEAAK